MAADLPAVLEALQPRLKRCRPLARACPQLLFDVAALLCGLRAVAMLDYAPGATPEQLQQALAPLAALAPAFQGCVLHLDGCCYLADRARLLRRLAALTADGDAGAGDWPLLLGFGGTGGDELALLPPGALLEQVRCLTAGIEQLLAGALARLPAGPQQQGQGQAPAPAPPMPSVDLGLVRGAPAMPTLNGLLLGYPAVYLVGGLEQAAAASRALSASRLRLFALRAECRGAGGGTLMAFTVPAELCDKEVKGRVGAVVRAAEEAAAAAGGGWSGVRLSAEDVGPRPVSL